MNTRILRWLSGFLQKIKIIIKSLVLLMVKIMMLRSMLWIWLAKHDARVSDFSKLQIYKCTNTQIHKCTNAEIHKCKNTQMKKWTNIQIHKYTNAQIHKCRELYRMGGAMLRLRPGEPWCDKCVTLYAGSALGKCDRSVGIAFRGVEPFVYLCISCLCICVLFAYLCIWRVEIAFMTCWAFTSSGTLRSC